MVDRSNHIRVAKEQFERQMDNEESIIDRGVQQYRIALIEARNNGNMADSMPGRWLSAEFLEKVSMKIRSFINDAMEGNPRQSVWTRIYVTNFG